MKKKHLFLLIICGFSSVVCLAQKFDNPLLDINYTYSESSMQEYMLKAATTKPERIKKAFEQQAAGTGESFSKYFAALYAGKKIPEVNEALLKIFTTEDKAVRHKFGLDDAWQLSIDQQFYHLYYAFGSKGKIARGRLTPRTEKAMLEVLWNRMLYKDDIHLARLSTWWMIGSENHDIVSKVSSLICSQIFMNEPAYKDRIYPDIGTGGGYKFWFHSMYADDLSEGPQGRASYKDGKAYTATDHHKEWVIYFNKFFLERARKGFFLEVASTHYMAVSIPYLMDVYDLCKDQPVKQKAEKMLDAIWSDWAQDQLNGVRGGAKTRVKDGNIWNDPMYKLADFYFGGNGRAEAHYFTQLLSAYTLKPIIWDIALDRQGLGEFAFISRKPGEEENIWPRPLGAERTMLCNTEARFVRYSWVTPDYILGCQMDHPAAVHSHLSVQARWLGITFKGENGPRVYPTDAEKRPDGWKYEHALCRAIQHENVMIVQQSRRWFQVNPDWYPAKTMTNKEYGIYLGDKHDQLIEKDGWIFVENGDSFLAVRVVMANDNNQGMHSDLVMDSYTWSSDKKMIYFKDNYAGMIFEASRRVHHKTLEAFMDDILDNPLVLDKTVVAEFNILHYRGCGKNAKEIYFNMANNEISMINGERINYSPDVLFDSPVMKSKYNSGIIKIKKGARELILDFNE